MSDPHPATPPPLPPSSQPPPVPAPAATEKIVAAFKGVDWKQLGMDFKTFGRRFATSDFAHITPEPHEMSAVAGHTPRMAALIVWRRALLMMACVLTAVLLIKRCFDPLTVQARMFDDATIEAQAKELRKLQPEMSEEESRKSVIEFLKGQISQYGEANIRVINGVMASMFIALAASFVCTVMAARYWRDFKKSRRMGVLAIGLLIVPQLVMMLIPWSALMDFKHLENPAHALVGGALQGIVSQADVVKNALRGMAIGVIFMSAIPLLYSLFNGVLRASLAAKTLVPASIVCGWGSILLALTISVPWFIVLSVVDQFQADALIFIGVVCLLAAPLSIVLKARKLGMPLTSDEATLIVRRSRHVLTGLNLAGALLLVTYLNEKDALTASQTITGVLHYFANLMLISVAAVDLLALLLNRAHLKLAADTTPGESLRQLGEVLPPH